MIWTILSWLYCLVCLEPEFEKKHPKVPVILAIVLIVSHVCDSLTPSLA